jgi:hypothetical protein
MAYPSDDGDIISIKPLGRLTFPGGGHSLTGVAKRKVLVWGELKAALVDTSDIILGERGYHAAFGLDSMDFVTFEPKITGTDAAATYEDDEGLHCVAYAPTNGYIHIVLSGSSAVTAGDDITLGYLAIGDDASAPELT